MQEKTSKEELEKMKEELKKTEEGHIRYTFLFIYYFLLSDESEYKLSS